LGLNKGPYSEALRRLTKLAALKGYSPAHDMTKPVPDGFKVRGVSSLYDKDGKLAAQWVKSSADDERREQLLREAVAALAEEIPRAQAGQGA
jgi:hypothetical protein